MAPEHITTQFAPPERAAEAALHGQARLLRDRELLAGLLDAMTEAVVILNPQRQIVFANRALRAMLGMTDADAMLGLRPGEAVGCARADMGPNGCGTDEQCAACGAVMAVMTSLDGREDLQECCLSRHDGETMELLVRATPLEVNGERFSIVALTDTSHQKRRRALERTFFHDLLNTAGGVRMLADLLAHSRPEGLDELRKGLLAGAERLIEEIRSQRDLLAAESRDLPVSFVPLRSRHLLMDLLETYRRHPAAEGIALDLASDAADVRFHSDPALLSRVLGNMVKNALEACQAGQTATAGCEAHAEGVLFWVHNPTHIPKPVQLQLFQRSFSTKGLGRGLGTYSMKLLTARYLAGRVDFVSTPADGTTFRAWYPLQAPTA